jgi:hypothetical protein
LPVKNVDDQVSIGYGVEQGIKKERHGDL